MSPKTDVSVERKQQIYQAAITCFNRKGYYQTTMDDIVTESGLSKGTLYWYFDSKKALFIGLMEELLDAIGQEWEGISADQTLSNTEKLKAILELFRAQFGEMVAFFGIIMEAWALTLQDEDVQKISREFYKPYLSAMEHIIQDGINQGEFRVEDPTATSAVILTIYDGLTLAVGAGLLQDQDPDELLDAAGALVLRGLGVDV